jgi:immune inhibitor A
MRQRIQSYDSTFGLDRTDAITLHKDSVPTSIRSQPAVSVFNDLKTWWYESDGHSPESHGRFQVGWTGVNVPKTGTKIRVKDIDSHGNIIEVEVRPAN